MQTTLGLFLIVLAGCLQGCYLHRWGAARLGDWGGIVDWPFFICLAIGVGNLAGLWRGEWSGAPKTARAKLNLGLALLVLAVLAIALSSLVKTP